MRSPRFLDFVAICLAAIAAAASRTSAVDHVVEFRCIQDDEGARYEIHPNPVVLVAGGDRIVFRTTDHESALPCATAYSSPNLVVGLWGPAEGIFLWYYDSTSQPQGPFCEPGTRSYDVRLYGSHGDINGSFGPGVIEITSSGDPGAPPSATIGIFAEAAALTCVLPESPGSHQAYVCARLHDGEVDRLSAAEFRIAGFPAAWIVTTTPGPGITAFGDPMGAGVRVSAPNCTAGVSGVVVLYHIDYEATTPAAGEIVQVLAAQPDRRGPRANLCSTSGVRETCALAGRAFLGPNGAPCTVSTQGATWTRVRSLFR